MASPGGHMFYIGLYKKHMKKSSCLKPYGLKLGYLVQWHHLVDLYQVCSNYAPEAKNGPSPASHDLHWLIYWRNMNKSSCLKLQGLEDDIGYEVSPSEPLPNLFKLYPWGQKNGPPLGGGVACFT